MKSFEKYVTKFANLPTKTNEPVVINEVRLRSIISKVVKWFASKLKNIGFGETRRIAINVPGNLKETAGGGLMNKQLGEYAEHVAAHVLEEELYRAGIQVINYGLAGKGRQKKYQSLLPDNRGRTKGGWQYGTSELKLFSKKLDSYTKAGEQIGKNMYQTIIKSEDVKLSAYEIITAGVAEAKNSTADLIVRKKSQQEVTDLIRASLKVYAADNIQFYNTSVFGVLFSFLGIDGKASAKNVISQWPESKEKVELIKRIADAHKEQYFKYKELKKEDPTIQNFKMATDFVNKLVADEGLGSQATQIYADFLEEMFTKLLADKKNKTKIVKEVFDRMDLSDVDAASTIYAVIYGDKKLSKTVLRSDTSPKFNALVKTELSKVDVEIRRTSKIGMFLDFKLDGTILFSANFFLKAGAGLQIGARLTDLL